ncbi:MAG TPA: DUF2283 domain-containing protein [Azospirillaceae bacterium]|nr:DUF2283 domain-containing protein [Azospirillaceae bacterium]
MTAQSPVFYDPSTDSMYVTLGPGPAARQRVEDDRDLVIDLDAEGRPVGYDIQFASQHMDVVEEALRLLRRSATRAA